ncbi:MAG TPA: hypothetical protein VES20_08915 [Bryobacteraceae bacterium]|nr:hypothetical protein [Bryobacteraceae bacterium]
MFRTKLAIAAAILVATAQAEKLTFEQRVEIVRGMNAEFATAKIYLPRSKKALEFPADGKYDKERWDEAGKTFGPAARAGDLIQITKVEIEDDRIVFEINGGMTGKRKWYENVQVGVGNSTTPISRGNTTPAPGGTTIALLFGKSTPALEASEIKKLLTPLMNFERRTATEQLVDTLPPEIQAAVKEKRAIEGMDRDQVILAVGKPRTKVRENREGQETEDWIYGQPPGKVTFVTFADGKVVRVRDAYAGLGGSTMPTLKPQI